MSARELLARTGVQIQNLKKPLRQLSGGQRQGVAIARAAGWGSKLIILDEPTADLDPIGRRDVRDMVASLKDQGVAILLNSHLLSEVERVCDTVAILVRGKGTGMDSGECRGRVASPAVFPAPSRPRRLSGSTPSRVRVPRFSCRARR